MSTSKKYQFITGDRVFAKMKGYPPWPARIIAIASEKTNNKRYHVSFYGTHQTAIIKAENLYLYKENKDKFGAPKKQKHFLDAIKEIEAELNSTNQEQDNIGLLPKPFTEEINETSIIDESNNSSDLIDINNAASPTKIKKKSLKHKIDLSETDTDGEIPLKSRKLTTNLKKITLKNNDYPSTDDEQFKTPKKTLLPRKKKELTDDSSTDEDSATFKIPNSKILLSTSRKSKSDDKIKVENSDENNEDISLDKPSTSACKQHSPHENQTYKDKKKKDKELKKRERKDKKKRIKRNFIIALVNGQCIKIPLYLNRPKLLDRDNAEYWDEMVLHYANALKDRLENGEKLNDPHQIMDEWTTLRSFEFVKHQLSESSAQKINFLRTEAHLLDMDVELKKSLSLHHADTDKCFEVLNQMKELPITPLMLKKQPDVVFTIRRMRNYIGNISEWNMKPKEIEEFRKKARKIRIKADEVYTKFKILFNALKVPNFWIYFNHQVDTFREKTKKMSLHEMLALVEEPT